MRSIELGIQDESMGAEEPADPSEVAGEQIARLESDFRARLVTANLRTEAVRAGMVDLDGLKLMDLSQVQLDDNDKIIDGGKLMSELRRSKPWLFGRPSSSSVASAPASKPLKQKTAMEMSDEEYFAAKTAVTKYRI
jgi:hypothetical protein